MKNDQAISQKEIAKRTLDVRVVYARHFQES